jgi:hypothetical protein
VASRTARWRRRLIASPSENPTPNTSDETTWAGRPFGRDYPARRDPAATRRSMQRNASPGPSDHRSVA